MLHSKDPCGDGNSETIFCVIHNIIENKHLNKANTESLEPWFVLILFWHSEQETSKYSQIFVPVLLTNETSQKLT
jgi:hypothetical protein